MEPFSRQFLRSGLLLAVNSLARTQLILLGRTKDAMCRNRHSFWCLAHKMLWAIMVELSMSNRREHSRTALNAAVMVRHPLIGEVVYKTRDISDGGVYVVVEGGEFPPLGSIVEVQVQGLPVPAPVLTMEVVRKGVDGFGMQFV